MITLDLKNSIEKAVRERSGEKFDELGVMPGVFVIPENHERNLVQFGGRNTAKNRYWSCRLEIDGVRYNIYFG